MQIEEEFEVIVHLKLKDKFVKTVCRSLEEDGHRVFQSDGDADTDIFLEMLKLDTEGNIMTVIADDTGILVCFFFLFDFPQTYLTSKCIPRERTLW